MCRAFLQEEQRRGWRHASPLLTPIILSRDSIVVRRSEGASTFSMEAQFFGGYVSKFTWNIGIIGQRV